MKAQYHCITGASRKRLSAFFVLLFSLGRPAFSQTANLPAENPFSQETVDALVSRSNDAGDFGRGLRVYTQAKSACFSCHRIGETGGAIGPDIDTYLQRTYTGEKIQLPIGFHVHSNGVAIRFQRPISSEQAGNALSHFAQCWNYRYSPGYGSKEYSVLHSPMIGHDCLSISAAHVLDQGQNRRSCLQP